MTPSTNRGGVTEVSDLEANRILDALASAPRRLLIGGEWVAAASGDLLDCVNPSTGEVITRLAAGGAPDIDAAVRAARIALSGPWRSWTPVDRQNLLLGLADLMEAHARELRLLDVVDMGKPVSMPGGLRFPIETVRFFAGLATKITGHTIANSEPGEMLTYTLREPVGVVGGIIAWNGPVGAAIWKLAPALAAGCTIVLKPAEEASLTPLRLGEFLQELGVPPGVVNIVTGVGEVAGAALTAHPDVDKIAFTGSIETGRRVVQAASGNLKRVSLELGGKSPNIVFVTGGSRIVDGPLAHGYFLEPTIFTDLPVDSRVTNEEIFGPIAAVMPFDDLDEVAERANNTRYGLGSGIWTTNLKNAHRLSRRLQAGVVWINTYSNFDPAVPFGGVKESGWGRELGAEAIDAYLNTKAVWVQVGEP
jgi:acyl-CoA reductase-like NAD-dependent aldehyde dehydrogenase